MVKMKELRIKLKERIINHACDKLYSSVSRKFYGEPLQPENESETE